MFVGPRNAVQLFYVASGFLISYILTDKNTYPKVIDFYVNRALRIYPIYLVVAILSLCAHVFILNGSFFDLYRQIPFSASAFLMGSNLLLFGQDWTLFMTVDHGGLVFTSDFRTSPIALYRGLLVPQAWTLGIEFTFYAIAPFVLRRRKLLVALLLASIALRGLLMLLGPGLQDPWTYRFFPTELALFLLGALSHQLLLPLYRRRSRPVVKLAARIATALLLTISLVYIDIPLNEMVKTAMLFATFVLLLPLAFLFQEEYSLDKWIGDLSYPIYIGHILVIFLVTDLAGRLGYANDKWITGSEIVLSIGFAMALNWAVGARFEGIRNHFKRPAVIMLPAMERA